MKKTKANSAGRITVRKVAELAGVSIGSVSSVLNNRHVERRISVETVEKIRAAAERLGYLPNISARRLRRRGGDSDSVVIGLITSFEAPIPVIDRFILALREAGAEGIRFNFSVMIEMFSAGHLRDVPGLLTGDHFNAALILNTAAEDDEFLKRVHLPYPVVLVNRIVPGYASVIEQTDAGSRSAEIMFRQRRRRPAVLHAKLLTQSTRARVDSFMQHLQQLLGRPAREIVAESLSVEAGYRAVSAALQESHEIDGLYAVSDSLAMGAYRAIKEAGLRIPGDVAVIGVGDYESAPFFDPPLSSVGVPHTELAKQASRLLMRRLLGQPLTPEPLRIPVVEEARESSGTL